MHSTAYTKRDIVAFLSGAFTYGALEILWRGYTHPTMLLLGGICFYIIFRLEDGIFTRVHILPRCFIYAAIITAAEFVFGIVLNIFLHLDIWDYSDLPFNLLGQICLPFYFLWVLLSIASCAAAGAIRFAFEKSE